MAKIQKNFRLEETAIRALAVLAESKSMNMTEVIELLLYREVVQETVDYHYDHVFYTEENGQEVSYEHLYTSLKAKEKLYGVSYNENS